VQAGRLGRHAWRPAGRLQTVRLPDKQRTVYVRASKDDEVDKADASKRIKEVQENLKQLGERWGSVLASCGLQGSCTFCL